MFTCKNGNTELGETRAVRRHWRAGATKFLAEIIVKAPGLGHRRQKLEKEKGIKKGRVEEEGS